VEFYQCSTLLGEATSSPYGYTWTNVAAGSYALTARAYDNDGVVVTSGVVNIRVNASPSVNLTSPTNEAVFTSSTVDLAADAADADGTIGKVEFYQGSGPGDVSLSWQMPGKAKEVIPADALFHVSSPELKAELTSLNQKLVDIRKERVALVSALNEKRAAVERIRQKITSEDPGMVEVSKARQEAETAFWARLEALVKENKEIQAVLQGVADDEAKLQKFGEDIKNLNQPAPEATK